MNSSGLGKSNVRSALRVYAKQVWQVAIPFFRGRSGQVSREIKFFPSTSFDHHRKEFVYGGGGFS